MRGLWSPPPAWCSLPAQWCREWRHVGAGGVGPESPWRSLPRPRRSSSGSRTPSLSSSASSSPSVRLARPTGLPGDRSTALVDRRVARSSPRVSLRPSSRWRIRPGSGVRYSEGTALIGVVEADGGPELVVRWRSPLFAERTAAPRSVDARGAFVVFGRRDLAPGEALVEELPRGGPSPTRRGEPDRGTDHDHRYGDDDEDDHELRQAEVHAPRLSPSIVRLPACAGGAAAPFSSATDTQTLVASEIWRYALVR